MECVLKQSWQVQLPKYPCFHRVSGLKAERGAGRAMLRTCVAQAVRVLDDGREMVTPCRDIVTLMLLHDAIVSRTVGDYKQNDPKLYGRTRELKNRAASRIGMAMVIREVE
jgi:hypothetical protein